jgi:hypothetical protein
MDVGEMGIFQQPPLFTAPTKRERMTRASTLAKKITAPTALPSWDGHTARNPKDAHNYRNRGNSGQSAPHTNCLAAMSEAVMTPYT